MGRQAAAMLVKLLISLPKAFKAVLMSRMEGEMKGTHVLHSSSTAAIDIASATHTHYTHYTHTHNTARTQLTR
jgi:hypothetical protein